MLKYVSKLIKSADHQLDIQQAQPMISCPPVLPMDASVCGLPCIDFSCAAMVKADGQVIDWLKQWLFCWVVDNGYY